MIINFNFKLHNDKQLRRWIDDTKLPEWKIKRLLLALFNANTLDEQLSIIEQNALNSDYNPSGEVTMFYVQGNNEVQICSTNYDAESNNYRRGPVKDSIMLN